MVELYISYRRSLGEKFKTNAVFLNGFVRYIGDHTDVCSLTLETCTSFLYYPNSKVTANWFCKHTALKGLFQWAIAREYMEKVPLPKEMPHRPPHLCPYIYSDEELKRLFSAALTYQKNRSTSHPECIQHILIVTYMLGLRVHETVSLKMKSIDMQESLVYINESKFYKSRITPFNDKVKVILSDFLQWRREHEMPEESDSYLFLDKKGNPIHLDCVRDSFKRIRKVAGVLRNDKAIFQPRIHDLRHTFAVNRLTQWYKEGADVQKLLPVLSTYLGHKHLCHTSVYLTMTDNLLEEANKRFEYYVNKWRYE